MSIFYNDAIQHSLLKVIAFVSEFQGEERDTLIEELQEDFVAFPQCEVEEAFFIDPLEVAFVAHDLLAGPVGAHEEVHVFGGPAVGDKGDDAAVAPLGDGEAGFLAHFAQHAVLGAFVGLELPSHSEPFVVVEVVLFFGAVKHQVLITAFEIAKGGLDHSLDSQRPKNLSYTS